MERIGEVRGRGGQQFGGGPSILSPLGSAGPPASRCCSFRDAIQHQGGVCSNSTLVPHQVPGTDRQELAVRTRDSDGTEEGG